MMNNCAMDNYSVNMITDVLHGHIIPLCESVGNYESLFYLRMTSEDMSRRVLSIASNRCKSYYIAEPKERHYYTWSKYEYIMLIESGNHAIYNDTDDNYQYMVRITCELLYKSTYFEEKIERIVSSQAHYKVMINHLIDNNYDVTDIVTAITGYFMCYKIDCDEEKNLVNALNYLSSYQDIRLLPEEVSEMITKDE